MSRVVISAHPLHNGATVASRREPEIDVGYLINNRSAVIFPVHLDLHDDLEVLHMSEDSINPLPPKQRGDEPPTKTRAVPWESLIGIEHLVSIPYHLARARKCFRITDPCPVEWHFSFETEAPARRTMIPSELCDCLSGYLLARVTSPSPTKECDLSSIQENDAPEQLPDRGEA